MLGTLDAGVGVRVTGVVEGGEWLRVDLREDGGAAFIHASLLKEMTPEAPEAPLEPFGPEWTVVSNQPCQVWKPNVGDSPDVTWSGDCVNGKASGQGRLTWQVTKIELGDSVGLWTHDGGMKAGKLHGRGTVSQPNGEVWSCEWLDGQLDWDKPEACTEH